MTALMIRTPALGLSVLAALALASTSMAQPAPGTPLPGVPGFTLTFDEYGNSLLNGGPNPNPVVAIAGGGLQYFLPGMVTPGDVVVRNIVDITPANPGISDLISFANIGGQGVLSFFSLIDDADDNAPADVPTFNFISAYGATEFGPEGNNSFTWIPDPSNSLGAVYIGISDGTIVPEPSTIVLAALGFVSISAIMWRRRPRIAG